MQHNLTGLPYQLPSEDIVVSSSSTVNALVVTLGVQWITVRQLKNSASSPSSFSPSENFHSMLICPRGVFLLHLSHQRFLPQLLTRIRALYVLNLQRLINLERTALILLVVAVIALLLLHPVHISNRDMRDPLFTLWVKRIIPPRPLPHLVQNPPFSIPIALSHKHS